MQVRALVLAALLVTACAPASIPDVADNGTLASTPVPTLPGAFHSAAGFNLIVPPGWTATDRTEMFNRRGARLLVLSNGAQPVADAQTGLLTLTDLPADHVVLELTEFSFPGGPGPQTESTFPLDWHAAQVAIGPYGLAPMLHFQHLLQSLTLTAYSGPDAKQADRDALASVVASIRPEVIPESGVYRGWDVLGPLATFPIGSVRHFSTPQSTVGAFFLVRGAHTLFALIDSAYQFMGAMKPCPIRYDPSARTFVCEATGDRWSRTGAQLTGGGLFGLAYHTAMVKDGLVLVGGSSMGGGERPPAEQDEFADPVDSPLPSIAPTKADVLGRYAMITTTAPIERADAKLVTRAQALASAVIRGASIRPEIEQVWILAYRGDVRFPGSAEVHGRWATFYVDPATGGAITMACCGDGDWPAGFDALQDLAGN
ncbi:MAG TPA: hypothetical protein VL333_02910 [Candidatus Saccharimonadales bacterium]|jgi:hypothetical protein|nr:hypothetical protein [Candidatus Saccharimonadales bacterium]